MPSVSRVAIRTVIVTWFSRVLVAISVVALSACSVAEKSLDDMSPSAKAAVQVQEHKTTAGHSFWYKPMPDADRTAVAITWQSDLANVLAGKETTPRVGIDLMLNGGAGGLPAEDIIADFQDLDAGSQLWAQPQEISGFIVSPKIHMEKASEIANLVLTQPNFEQRWLDREKKNLLDAANERQSLVAGLAWNLYREVTIGDHPYKNFWSLTPIEGVESIQLEDVKNWHAAAFSTAAMSITVAGNADVDSVSAAIDSVLDTMPNHQPLSNRDFPAPVVPGKTILLHRPNAEKSIVLIIGNLPSHSDGKDIELQLGVGVLGFGKQSRLFKAVRSGLRAAYGFGAGMFDMTREHTVLHLSGEVETTKLQEALDETKSAYEKFRNEGVSVIEFPIAKRFYLQRIRDELKKPPSVAYLLMEANLNNQGIDYVPSLLSEIQGLDRSAVNQVVKEDLPEYDDLLKIIVSPDDLAIDGACVISTVEQWEEC